MIINKLSNICSYTEGYVNPEITNENYFSENGMPWLKVADLVHGENIYFTKYHLSPLGESLAKNENQIFKKGTIVWSKSGSIGLTSILQINVMANRGILNIKPNNKYVKNKYLFYFLYKNKNIFSSKGTGIVLKHFYGPNLMNEEINLPNIKMQNQIIDIIEQNETLFLKYSNCIRIDTLENVQIDMKNLIAIIEPLENIEINIMRIKNKLIKLLINLYNYSNNKHQVVFNSVIKILSNKYKEQRNYFATNAVGELEIDYQKIINLSGKIPSRANVSPLQDSFIFSKLVGENKIFYFKEKPKEVFSTGFFNFKTEYHDHILGFMLSDDFKLQKEYLSTGTTMQGINNSSLELIKLKKSNLKSNVITTTLYDLENNLVKIKALKTKLVELLIK